MGKTSFAISANFCKMTEQQKRKTCCLGNGKCSSLVKTCYLEIGGEIAKTVTGHNHRESWILG